MVKNSQPKFQSVYDYLVRGIESGFYRPETRFPSERKLAEKLNVNVATVRRAFRDLITSGVVEKRVGDGTYLTRGGGTANGAEYVNIVLSNYQGDTQDEIAELALEEGARRNLRCRIVRLGSEEMAMFVRTAIRFRQPTMVLGDDLLTAATIRDIAGNAWLFAVLANRLDQLGIPSVIGDRRDAELVEPVGENREEPCVAGDVPDGRGGQQIVAEHHGRLAETDRGADEHRHLLAAEPDDAAAEVSPRPLFEREFGDLVLGVALIVRKHDVDVLRTVRRAAAAGQVGAVPDPFFDHAAGDEVAEGAPDGRDVHIQFFRQLPLRRKPRFGPVETRFDAAHEIIVHGLKFRLTVLYHDCSVPSGLICN